MTIGTRATGTAAPAPAAPPQRRWAWTLPTHTPQESTHIVDAAFGLVTMFRTLPGVPSTIPVSDVVGILFIGIMLLRRPRYRLGRASLLIPGYFLLLAYLVAVSLIGEVDWIRRSVHITIMMMLALLVGTGRAHLPSLLRGAITGLVINAALFYAGLAPDTYGGNLTGYLEDKNHAALVIGVIGITTCAYVRRRYVAPLLVLTVGGVWLTGSRTTLAALTMAGVWMLLRPVLPSLMQRLALGGGIVLALNVLVDDYSRVGVFSDRTGTDLLRQRIDEATTLKLESTPFYG
ncbi:hypothetical protein, partial [Actinomyces sp. MRS3W]|uniref:hypothetical protein n=1 Tax=Actinomyces sp. MRS3W TaxID=2800796 RepID=UPI0028FD799F